MPANLPPYRASAAPKPSHMPSRAPRPSVYQPSLLPPPVNMATGLGRGGSPGGVSAAATMLQRDGGLATTFQRDRQPSMMPSIAPSAPPSVPSILISPEDVKMATRQPFIEALPKDERQRQEDWAQEMIKRTGACPQGYDWDRMPGGYQCRGGGHGVTDELLAEGKGGLYALRDRNWDTKDGLYYPDGKGKFRPV